LGDFDGALGVFDGAGAATAVGDVIFHGDWRWQFHPQISGTKDVGTKQQT
jgi:hypothetical protein